MQASSFQRFFQRVLGATGRRYSADLFTKVAARGKTQVSAYRDLWHPVFVVAACLCLAAAGCMGTRQNPAATQPATLLPADSTRSPYWLQYPAVATVSDGNYGALWNAARRAAQACSFSLDRIDYRDGIMTSKPQISKQFFEVWKGDVVDAHDLLQSSLGTMRRTIYFQITRGQDGGYILHPKVIVDRYSAAERRITSVAQYLNIFSYEHGLVGEVTDEGQLVPVEYWYAVGRDPHLEKHLADMAHGYAKGSTLTTDDHE